MKQLDPFTVDQLLFHTIYYLSGRASTDQSVDQETGVPNQWIEFDLPPEWE